MPNPSISLSSYKPLDRVKFNHWLMKLGRKEIIVESPVFLSCFRDNNKKTPDTLNSSTDDTLFLCFILTLE